jgi:hypothetical protein
VTTIVVAGALANKPLSGGEAWVRLSWTLGLRRLGFDVWFVEQISASDCVDVAGHLAPFAASVNRAFFRGVVATHGLAGRAALLCDDGQTEGVPRCTLRDALHDAVLLVNISGHLRDRTLLGAARRRAFVDIDPGYTQIWHLQGLGDDRLDDHDCLFTIAENIGRPGCRIPTLGLRWHTVRQPVVLDDWPVLAATERDRFTTVGTWRSTYGALELDGVRYGQKVHQFRRFLELPARAGARFELALDIDPAETPDLEALDRHGWHRANPRRVAGDAEAFRRYVQGSGGEFSAAQGVYVDTMSGWFSDRSVRYLASGRPVVVQDTGFDRHLPVGDGLHAFRELSDAAAAVDSVLSDYDGNSRAARAIAEEYFDSDIVLARFLDDARAA